MKSITELVSDVANTIALPLSDEDRFNTAAVVGAMNRAMDERIIPELLVQGGEYLVVRQVIPLRDNSDNILYPDALIPIPRRAYGRVLREVKYLPPNMTKRIEEVNVPQTTITEYDTLRSAYSAITAYPLAFFVENDSVGIHGDPSALQGSLVFYYYIRPSTLSNKTTEFAEITNATYSTNTLTLTTNAVGAELTSYCAVSQTKLFDIYRKSTGALFEFSVPFTRTGSTTFTSTDSKFSSDSPAELKAWQQGGYPLLSYQSADLYLVPAEACQFSMLPEEWDTLLVYHTCSKILEALGDTEGLQVNEERIRQLHERLKSAYASRVRGERMKVTDRRSIARQQRYNSTWIGARYR